jgi:dethiobiotin synthetase
VAPAVAFPDGSAPTPLRLREHAAYAASHGDFLLVETAGGVLSPYCGAFTAADLAADLGLPVLLVARNGLGPISHTALAIAELRRRALPLLGLILVNTSPALSPDQATNAALIAQQTGLTPLGTLPYVGSSREPSALAAALEAAVDLQALEPLLAALST